MELDPNFLKGARHLLGVTMGSARYMLDIPTYAELYLRGRRYGKESKRSGFAPTSAAQGDKRPAFPVALISGLAQGWCNGQRRNLNQGFQVLERGGDGALESSRGTAGVDATGSHRVRIASSAGTLTGLAR
jgi:hypothetical protein